MSAGRHPTPLGRFLVSTALCALMATPVAAQEAEEGLFALLGRLILGAGTAKVAIDTPQAVTVLEQEDLDREQATAVGEIFASVPGVQATGASGRAAGQAFNIRGIGNTEQTASEARIIVTVDGAPKFFEQYRMGSFFGDLELFKRVEVLRGPASSTLYGSGAIGGVVSFTTKDASDFLAEGKTTALRFKTGFDSNGEGKRGSVIYATRAGENAEFLGALNYSTSHDIEDGSGNVLPGTAFDRWSGLAKGTWTFGNDADQSISLSLSRTDSELDDTVVAQTGGAAVDAFGSADVETVDDTVVLGYSFDPADNALVDLDVTLSHTETAVAKDDFSFGFLCSPGTFQVFCDSDFSYRTTTLKVENTADLSSGAWANFLTMGVQLSNQDRIATSTAGALAFHPEGEDRKIGLYAQGEFTWDDRLTLIPGIRVDFGDLTPSAAAVAAGAEAQSDTAVSPKLAALYKINDAWGVFGSVARTERMPTLDELFSSQPEGTLPARTPSLNLEKEEAETIELGLTYQREGILAAGDSLQLKATAFHNDVTNLIATTPRVAGGPSVPYFSNIEAAKIWGAEIEGSYDAEHWFGQLAYSQVKSRDSATGLTLADTPAENVALTLGAKLPRYDLVVGWRASYFDAITTSSATTSGSSYDTHDLFVTWKPQSGALAGFEMNFGVDNVFDATYRNNLVQDNAAGRSFEVSLAKTLDW